MSSTDLVACRSSWSAARRPRTAPPPAAAAPPGSCGTGPAHRDAASPRGRVRAALAHVTPAPATFARATRSRGWDLHTEREREMEGGGRQDAHGVRYSDPPHTLQGCCCRQNKRVSEVQILSRTRCSFSACDTFQGWLLCSDIVFLLMARKISFVSNP